MADAKLRFEKAVYLIKNGPKSPNDSNEVKLQYYKYFKQAMNGDNTASAPWAIQLEAKAKWDAWESAKGMSQEDAMKKYAELLDAADPNWEDHEVLKSADAPK